MKKIKFLVLFCGLISLSACNNMAEKTQIETRDTPEVQAVSSEDKTTGEPWTEEQLLEPADLAHSIETAEALPVIFSLGAGNIIPGSKDTGAAGEKANLENLKKELEHLPKDTEIVLYCGCCPFKICPNVRPAFKLLNEMKFTNHQLLNLRENIKVDWLDKGYAVGD